jgi:thymidylate kinase
MDNHPRRSPDPTTPPAAQGSFLVLVGIDGSGKSSVIADLRVEGLATTAWKELRNHELPQMLAPDVPTQIKNRLSPLSRSMFIGGHVVAQYEYLVRPSLTQGIDVLLDSYYFKLLAKETLFHTLHQSFTELCEELPPPDCVIFLDVSPDVSFDRKKGALSPYEYFDAPGRANFIRFQSQLRDHILLQLSHAPLVKVIDGNLALDVVVRGVTHVIQEFLTERRAGHELLGSGQDGKRLT